MTQPDQTTKHNHELLPFGRKVDPGLCPRCDELRSGAEPRPKHAWMEGRVSRQEQEEQRIAEVRHHFRPGHDQRCSHGGNCQFDQW